MRNLITAARKSDIGYFGWLYYCYLEEEHTASWATLMEREDWYDILVNIQEQCRARMELYLEFVGKDKLNKHKLTSRLAKELYVPMIETMKRITFNSCLCLLQYAEWMVD